MGNVNGKGTLTLATSATKSADESYRWPKNLYVETRDMAAAAFLVYAFSYILDTARKVGLKGMNVDKQGRVERGSKKKGSSRLNRSFTPAEVKQIVANNREVLAQYYPSVFENPRKVERSLDILQKRVDAAAAGRNDRPLSLVEFDDHHQNEEMVYAVAKDDINRRITLCFRGTDTKLSKETNWNTNLHVKKVPVPVPGPIQKIVKGDVIHFHGGFYKYIFGTTATPDDAPNKRKYDEILEDIKPLLAANPGYKLYVTGHSLGGALASIVAFYLACEKSLPKPITCINFAAPRVGDKMYLKASTALERTKRLRILRVVNNKDSIAMVPVVNYYHAGFQIRLNDDPKYKPEITYPKLKDTRWKKWTRVWGNSLIASFNFSYDHGSYRKRIWENKEFLEQQDLNVLYGRPEMTGFTWMEV